MGRLELPDKWRDEDDRLDGGPMIGQGGGPRQSQPRTERGLMPEGFTRLGDDLTIPAGHPLAGREAWQCNICQGIFYPEDNEPVECPYCTDEDEAA